jgi:hypothetical protein
MMTSGTGGCPVRSRVKEAVAFRDFVTPGALSNRIAAVSELDPEIPHLVIRFINVLVTSPSTGGG